jgi:hypothetical protein
MQGVKATGKEFTTKHAKVVKNIIKQAGFP